MGTPVHRERWSSLCTVVICGVIMLGGCTKPKEAPKPPPPPAVVTARHTSTPVKVDGVLDDEAWQTATVYQMSLSRDRIAKGRTLTEGGEVRLAWDDTNLYVGIKFVDSDIVAVGEEDQLHHYALGDLVEVFVKPGDETWYWELYATPGNKKTSFMFPGRGRLGMREGYDCKCGLQVAAQCKGSLNKWEDHDTHWTAELAMPIKDLTTRGETFEPGAKWRILIARYNYSRYLPHKELSMVPPLAWANYHRHEDYGVLELVK